MNSFDRPSKADDQPHNLINVRAHVLTRGWQQAFDMVGDEPDLAVLNAAARKLDICNRNGIPIQFVAQTQSSGQRHYEQQIYRTGCVPTRPDNLHDLYNACAWLTFPETKAALNALHVAQPLSQTRSRQSDAATLFDESGAILVGPNPALASFLIEHQWRTAFVTHRAWWETHSLIVFGHAVLEKLHAPYPGMIVKTIYQPWQDSQTITTACVSRDLDRTLANRWLAHEFNEPSDLFPIPVLGVPGADPANEQPTYYQNSDVFRPKRQKPTTHTE